jgi:hypothetical protein
VIGVRSRDRSRVLGYVGLAVLIISGGTLAVAGGLAAHRSGELATATARADGVVVAQARHGRSAAPVVEFSPAGAPPLRVEGRVSSRPPAYRVGEHVSVLYDPAAPERAFLDTLWEKWFLPLLLGLVGLPDAIIGLGLCVAAALGRSRDQRLRDTGEALSGHVVATERMRGKRHLYRLIAEASGETGLPRRFASAPAQVDDPDQVVGQSVMVYVDREAPARYLVDLG